MKHLALVICLVHAACIAEGGNYTGDYDFNADTSGAGGSGTPSSTKTCTPKAVPWLHTGNFWRVAWTNVTGELDVIFSSNSSGDAGSYDIELGPPVNAGDFVLYPLKLTGQWQGYAPLWASIGTNKCGDIVVSNDNERVYVVYNAQNNAWSGVGFWQQFGDAFGVSRSNTMIESLMMEPSTYLTPPFTTIGRGTFETGVSEGNGCDYYAGVGTVCGGDTPDDTTSASLVEYWHDIIGPVGFQDSANRNSGGDAGHEKRMEVFFFADNASPTMQFNHGSNTCARPVALEFGTKLASQITVIPAHDIHEDAITTYAQPPQAQGMQSWYRFDVTAALAKEDLLVFFGWTGNADYEVGLFSAPDSKAGFQYLMAANPMSTAELRNGGVDYLDGGADLSGIYQPGSYLIGVRRIAPKSGDVSYTMFTLIQ